MSAMSNGLNISRAEEIEKRIFKGEGRNSFRDLYREKKDTLTLLLTDVCFVTLSCV